MTNVVFSEGFAGTVAPDGWPAGWTVSTFAGTSGSEYQVTGGYGAVTLFEGASPGQPGTFIAHKTLGFDGNKDHKVRIRFAVGTATNTTWGFSIINGVGVSWALSTEKVTVTAPGASAQFDLAESFFTGASGDIGLYWRWEDGTLRVRIWDTDGPEPSTWDAEVASSGQVAGADVYVNFGGRQETGTASSLFVDSITFTTLTNCADCRPFDSTCYFETWLTTSEWVFTRLWSDITNSDPKNDAGGSPVASMSHFGHLEASVSEGNLVDADGDGTNKGASIRAERPVIGLGPGGGMLGVSGITSTFHFESDALEAELDENSEANHKAFLSASIADHTHTSTLEVMVSHGIPNAFVADGPNDYVIITSTDASEIVQTIDRTTSGAISISWTSGTWHVAAAGFTTDVANDVVTSVQPIELARVECQVLVSAGPHREGPGLIPITLAMTSRMGYLIAVPDVPGTETWCEHVAQPKRNQPIQDEVVGEGDGSETEFTTDFPYTPLSLEVEVDGISVGADESDPTTGTFTMSFAPDAGERITASYRYGGFA